MLKNLHNVGPHSFVTQSIVAYMYNPAQILVKPGFQPYARKRMQRKVSRKQRKVQNTPRKRMFEFDARHIT